MSQAFRLPRLSRAERNRIVSSASEHEPAIERRIRACYPAELSSNHLCSVRGRTSMKAVVIWVSCVAFTTALLADEPGDLPTTTMLTAIVSAAQSNYERIETLTATYTLHETMPGRRPRDGFVDLVWDQKNGRFRSALHIDGLVYDTVTTSSEFVRLGPGKREVFPSDESRKYWSADVFSPIRLFGTQDEPLWKTLKTYATWDEANDRMSITSSGEGDDLVYTMRMHYVGHREINVFVTSTFARANAFNPTLVVRSKGKELSAANLVDVTAWTYETVSGIAIPKSISVSDFDERTGMPVRHRSVHLTSARVNEAVRESAFQGDVPLSSGPISPVADSPETSSFRRESTEPPVR